LRGTTGKKTENSVVLLKSVAQRFTFTPFDKAVKTVASVAKPDMAVGFLALPVAGVNIITKIGKIC
jgi:hypothetical protein